MDFSQSYSNLSAWSLILGFGVLMVGVSLFLSRPADMSLAPAAQRLILERSAIGLAAVLNAVGLLLLSEHMGSSGGGAWARTGAYALLIGTVLLLNAEALGLSHQANTYPLIVAYVCLALMGQAAVGLGIALSGELPTPLGWATFAWNMAWLAILPLATPGDMYYPVLHHLMPLVIGISLLATR